MPDTKFCRYCGETVVPHAKFCNECGAVLKGAAAPRPPAPPVKQPLIDQQSRSLDSSYLQSGHAILTPFQKTIVNGTVCYTGTTRHPNGHRVDVRIYLMTSFADALSYKEQLLRAYEARGYVTQKTARDTWMGALGETLVSVVAKETSVLGVPTTMVISTPL